MTFREVAKLDPSKLLPSPQNYRGEIERPMRSLAESLGITVQELGTVRASDHTPLSILKLSSGPLDGSRPVIVLSAGVHGDETAGPAAIQRFLAQDFLRYSDKVSFVIYPCVNPGGYDRISRRNPGYVDLNRSFHLPPDKQPEEVAAVQADWAAMKLTAALHIDLHEDKRSLLTPGLPGTIPAPGLYAYESATPGRELAARVLADSGQAISPSPDAYGDPLKNGVSLSSESIRGTIFRDNPDFEGSQFHRSARSQHSITYETNGDDSLALRAEQHRKLICGSLDRFLEQHEKLAPVRGDTPIQGRSPIHGCPWVKSAEDIEYLAPLSARTRPTVEAFHDLLRKAVDRIGTAELVTLETVDYHTSVDTYRYDHCLVRSRAIGPQDPIVVVRANVHGREVDSALTILHRLEEMFQYADERGVKLIVFPMDNPSGYATMNYRNVEDTEKKAYERDDWVGNNLGVVYLTADGREIDAYDTKVNDPVTGKPFEIIGFKDIRHAKKNYYIPPEARVTLEAIDKYVPISQVRGFLDLHQDPFCTTPLTYQYGFKADNSEYKDILDSLPRNVIKMKNHDNERHPYTLEGYQESIFAIGSGGAATNPDMAVRELHGNISEQPEVVTSAEVRQISDEFGFIVTEDGTLPSLFNCHGVPHVATIEVSSVTAPRDTEEIFMSWIRGYIERASKGK